MKRFALIALPLALAACGSNSEPTFTPVEQQNVLTRLTVAAGYEVAGVPFYKNGSWASNVRVAGCKTNVTVVAQQAPESVHPASFTVLSVGDKSLEEVSPGVNGLLMSAEALKAAPGVKEQLGCNA